LIIKQEKCYNSDNVNFQRLLDLYLHILSFLFSGLIILYLRFPEHALPSGTDTDPLNLGVETLLNELDVLSAVLWEVCVFASVDDGGIPPW
jgi:hypothetical protein